MKPVLPESVLHWILYSRPSVLIMCRILIILILFSMGLQMQALEAIEVKPIVPDFKGVGELTPGYPSDHLGIVARFKINQTQE